jgi:DNA-binding transcriptional LysR family regulator
VIEADNESVILNLIESGLGVSVAREELAPASEHTGRIAIWPAAKLATTLWFIQSAQRTEALRESVRARWRQEEAADCRM